MQRMRHEQAERVLRRTRDAYLAAVIDGIETSFINPQDRLGRASQPRFIATKVKRCMASSGLNLPPAIPLLEGGGDNIGGSSSFGVGTQKSAFGTTERGSS
jgi:hypothetical protein